MKLAFIRSGSKGNATLISSQNAFIQIDMGVAFKSLKDGFAALNKEAKDLQGVFVTHNHSDHIKSLSMMKKYCPIYSSLETYLDADKPLISGVGEEVGDLLVFPFSVSHDAPDPLNFVIYEGEKKYVHVTDTGYLDESLFPILENADYYLMEFNHDVEMEIASHRPLYLKRRIMGDFGHLSNVVAASYLTRLIGPNTKGIYLGHLSDECNTHEIALSTLYNVFKEEGVSLEGIEVLCTSQEHMVLGGEK